MGRMPLRRKDMSPYLAEFLGTALLILLGCGTNANGSLKKTYGSGGWGWIVTTTGWAVAVFIPAMIFHSASGAHFNPALTIGLAAAGKFNWALVPGYAGAQLAGGIVGGILVWIHFKTHFDESEPGSQLGVFSTGPAIPNTTFNLISEIIGTFVLVFTLSVPNGSQFGGFFTYAVILSIGIALGGTTGYAINPARDLGPRIAHAIVPIKGKGGSNWGYAWIPVIGPIIGGIIGALVGAAIFPG
jgi:glycerol uptake facilitator protein